MKKPGAGWPRGKLLQVWTDRKQASEVVAHFLLEAGANGLPVLVLLSALLNGCFECRLLVLGEVGRSVAVGAVALQLRFLLGGEDRTELLLQARLAAVAAGVLAAAFAGRLAQGGALLRR